jgi:hypothetical protein
MRTVDLKSLLIYELCPARAIATHDSLVLLKAFIVAFLLITRSCPIVDATRLRFRTNSDKHSGCASIEHHDCLSL